MMTGHDMTYDQGTYLWSVFSTNSLPSNQIICHHILLLHIAYSSNTFFLLPHAICETIFRLYCG